MKLFENPDFEIVKILVNDIVTASGGLNVADEIENGTGSSFDTGD